MKPEQFRKVWKHLTKDENLVHTESGRTEWHKENTRGWLEDGGYRWVMELPNGSVVELVDHYGKEVTREVRPPRPEELRKIQEADARLKRAEDAAQDLVIPKEYRELVIKALKIAKIALEENKQATWIINDAQAKRRAISIDLLLRNVLEKKNG